MIREVVFTPGVESDLDEIEQYLALRFSARNAERYMERIVRFCKSIALVPYRGTSLNELHPALRSVGMERVSIQFRIQETQVVIRRLLCGSNDRA